MLQVWFDLLRDAKDRRAPLGGLVTVNQVDQLVTIVNSCGQHQSTPPVNRQRRSKPQTVKLEHHPDEQKLGWSGKPQEETVIQTLEMFFIGHRQQGVKGTLDPKRAFPNQNNAPAVFLSVVIKHGNEDRLIRHN